MTGRQQQDQARVAAGGASLRQDTLQDVARLADFVPPRWLANRHLQSIVPSLPLRRPSVEHRTAQLMSASRDLVLDCGDGVRLLARQSTQADAGRGDARGVVVLHHGWEGSAESLYLLSVGQSLFDAGFDVVRLNFRDHGDTHGLNQELFHSCRIAEVVGAVRRVQELNPGVPLSLAGFSLGGNFALRVGARARAAGIVLHRIVAVCPVLDPRVTLQSLETGAALYREYFLLKWRRSLRKKQAAWPGVYDFSDMLKQRSLTTMTDFMVRRYTEYPDLQTYLGGYAITGDALADLETPSKIVLSLDDPMIPAADLRRLKRVPALELVVTRHGGHCGFVQALGGATWVDQKILAAMSQP